VRLRYEVTRQFAPYIGVAWGGKFGQTADLAQAAGEKTRETSFVAGVRFWF
jgi:copper resistance protein B